MEELITWKKAIDILIITLSPKENQEKLTGIYNCAIKIQGKYQYIKLF